jgi:IS30 family transposase
MPIHPSLLREDAAKLTKGFFEATYSLGLSNREVGEILGVSEATISRAKKRGSYFTQTRHHQWLIAELLIKACGELKRIYDHPRKEKHWFTTYNHELRAFPINLLHSMAGLMEVVRHLESRQLP